MKLQKFRWSKVYESTEEELTDFLRARTITAERCTVEAFETSETQTTDQIRTLWCAEGSLAVQHDDASVPMQPGDGLPLPAGSTFTVAAGMTGCVYYESA